MDRTRLQLRRLAERVLQGGALPLALLLEVLVPVARLRALARRLGVVPKGGFRIDKAPARVLAPLLADRREPDEIDQVVALLAPETAEPAADEGPAPGAAGQGTGQGSGAGAGSGPARAQAPDLAPIVRLKEQEIERLRGALERARHGAVRASERESELRREVDDRTAQVQRLRGELAAAQRAAAAGAPRDPADRALAQRVRDLEQEIEARAAADEALRRQLAQDRTRLRQLEQEVAELEPLVPKGRRRRRPPEPPPAATPERRFLLPYFAPSFYRSLDGKDRRSVERALQAILLFCTEGHAYPGLEVKQLGGQPTWSLRASLGLRVYFRRREDGDVEILELADREEQRTTLRRLKDRS